MTPTRLLFMLLALFLSLAAPVSSARAEEETAKEGDAKPAPKHKKKAAKKKTFDYERSKYKSREPSQTSIYKFNEKGDPIEAKKPAPKKKKRSEPPESEAKEGSEACGSEGSCAEKKSEADAL
jgi:hypothetical protein